MKLINSTSALIFICLFICQNTRAQNEYLFTEDFVLSWDQFKAVPDSNSNGTAAIATTLGYSMSKDSFNFIIKTGALFNPDSSWTRTFSNYALNHEYYHFKIAEIARRMMMKELKEFDLQEYKLDIEWWVEDRAFMYGGFNSNLQDQYDNDTDNGSDSIQQGIWEIKIDNWLQELYEFRYRYIIICFNKDDEYVSRKLTDSLPQ